MNGWLLEGLSAETSTSVTFEEEDVRRRQAEIKHYESMFHSCRLNAFLLVIVGRFANNVKTPGQELVQFGWRLGVR